MDSVDDSFKNLFKSETSELWDWLLEIESYYDSSGLWYHRQASEYWDSGYHLGEGTFGEVRRCVSGPLKNITRAVKRVSKGKAKDVSRRELKALVTFSDPNIAEYKEHFVQFLGWFDDVNHLYIAMEYLEHGDLHHFIRSAEPPLPESQAASIVAQVARALRYMHRESFVHRDIKPENILVSRPGPNWHVKVADFGASKNTKGSALGSAYVGTIQYMAPEQYEASGAYTAAVDVWALGAVAFCLRAGKPPFPNPEKLKEYVRDPIFFPTEPLQQSSHDCKTFVIRTMSNPAENRPNIDDVIADPWLTELGVPDGHSVGDNSNSTTNEINQSSSRFASQSWSSTHDSLDNQHSPELSCITPTNASITEPKPEQEELQPALTSLAASSSQCSNQEYAPKETPIAGQTDVSGRSRTGAQESLEGPVTMNHQAGARPVFGLSLDDLNDRDGTVVPHLLSSCFHAVERFGLLSEEIYRLRGNHLNEIKSAFETDTQGVDFHSPESFYQDIYSVAFLVKEFLKALPDPLFTSERYSEFIDAARLNDSNQRRDKIHGIIKTLPKTNYEVAKALFLHLHKVQEHSNENRMTIKKLGIYFGAILMRGYLNPPKKLLRNPNLQIRVAWTILEDTLHIFDENCFRSATT